MADQTQYIAELEDMLTAWLQETILELKENAAKKKVSLTGETIASIVGNFEGLNAKAQADILINFKNSGRYLDWKKRPEWNKLAPVDLLEQWVLKVGLSKFKYVPGYENSKTVPTQQQAAKRIAWGIAVSRYRRGVKKKAPWFAKLFYKRRIGIIINRMIEITGTSSVRAITENLQ